MDLDYLMNQALPPSCEGMTLEEVGKYIEELEEKLSFLELLGGIEK